MKPAFKPALTRLFTGDEIRIGIRAGIVSRDILLRYPRPATLDERLKLEAFFLEKEQALGFKK